MKKNNPILEWAMINRQIIILFVGILVAGGVVSLIKMPKQEMPEYTIRKGLVIGVYPGASSEQVEEQLTKPLERYLFTYSEVNRKSSVSRSEDGVCYIFIDLADEVKDHNIVWSKIKHGVAGFKSSLPSGVLAVVVNDNFGDVSSVLVTMESDDKSFREIDTYCDRLEDRLRAVGNVANVRRYGSQKEQISLYLDNEKLAAYGISGKALTANMLLQGFTTMNGVLENEQSEMPIHIAETFRTEQEIADQIIYSSPQGDVVRVKDIGRVVREYPRADSYITHNGHKCVLLSVEVKSGSNIISFGKEVDEVLNKFKAELPESVNINRIADQPEIVSHSINTFLKELLIAILAVILVIFFLMPFRVSLVASLSIPITIAITFVVMYAFGIPLNFVTLAALMAVLGIIVDDTIVVVDNYIDKLDDGEDRRNATVRSVMDYFYSILSATLAISITFIPFLYTTKGNMNDMIQHFPWTVCIALFSSLLVGVLVIPIIQYYLIKKGLHLHQSAERKARRSILDIIQAGYDKALDKVFEYPRTTLVVASLSIVAGVFIFLSIPIRMMPIAERDQFAVEIHLPKGSPLEKTAVVADSLETILRKDHRVKSVSAFIGTSSPRFHFLYSPHMPSSAYGQFVVNTISNKATEELLDEYTNKYAFFFPEAYVRFKQLDFQMAESPLELRLIGEDMGELKKQAMKVENHLRTMDECLRVRNSLETPVQSVKIDLNPEETSRLGINKTLVSLGIATNLTGMKIGEVWESNYAVPVVVKPENGGKTITDLQNVQVSGLLGSSVPLRQISTIEAAWNEGVITHRRGQLAITVSADLKRGVNEKVAQAKLSGFVDKEVKPTLPPNVSLEYGGIQESDKEVFGPLFLGAGIALLIIYFILVFHFRKLKLASLVMFSILFCVFGAAFGIWITGIDFNAFAILGVIGLAGIIVRNGIIMYDYTEYLRFRHHESVRQAALDAAKRRMRPIFLTSSVAAMGVLPLIISQSPMWAPMGTIIFFGALITMVFIVFVLPVLYWLVYQKEDSANELPV